MKQINKDDIVNVINEYINGNPLRPALIWFHTNIDLDAARQIINHIPGCANCGNAIFIDKNGKIQSLTPSDAGFIIPGTFNKDTKFFLFHRFTEQLKAPFLKYAVNLMKVTKLPVICVVNEYSKEEEPNFDVSQFEEWFFK